MLLILTPLISPTRTGQRFPAYQALDQEAVSGRRLFEFDYYRDSKHLN